MTGVGYVDLFFCLGLVGLISAIYGCLCFFALSLLFFLHHPSGCLSDPTLLPYGGYLLTTLGSAQRVDFHSRT